MNQNDSIERRHRHGWAVGVVRVAANARRPRAFTLLDLVVALAVVSLLTLTILPALGNSKVNSKAIQCLNNNRQLCVAWRMYAADNRERLVYSSDDGTGVSNPLNQYAWTLTHMDFSPGNVANWNITNDIIKRPLWPYSGQNPSIYKCPSDNSVVVVNGEPTPRVRSMSMNLYLGGFAGTSGGIASAQTFSIYTNLIQVGGGLPTPSPAKLWVFMDQREDEINWGNFFTDMTGYSPGNSVLYKFGDLPGSYHHFSASLSYADGHGDIHRWVDPRTTPPLTFFSIVQNLASPRNFDIAWLQDHSTRPK